MTKIVRAALTACVLLAGCAAPDQPAVAPAAPEEALEPTGDGSPEVTEDEIVDTTAGWSGMRTVVEVLEGNQTLKYEAVSHHPVRLVVFKDEVEVGDASGDGEATVDLGWVGVGVYAYDVRGLEVGPVHVAAYKVRITVAG
ncbi:MAG TPA: hypothetical protein VI997_08430 [Candidatus Thermoplasmatota archaeon]|nr:hypothetical protein [Candidatus Thermoplasmatota archaeon]